MKYNITDFKSVWRNKKGTTRSQDCTSNITLESVDSAWKEMEKYKVYTERFTEM